MCFTAVSSLGQSSTAELDPGLLATFRSEAQSESSAHDLAVLPSVEIYVPAGQPPTPFLPAGPFEVAWSGFLTLDLRSEYQFQADLNGELTLQINQNTVLKARGSGLMPPGKSIRLNKGTNFLTATFRSPEKGDAWVRLEWIPRRGTASPIPFQALSHARGEPGLKKASERRLGRELFLEHRCAQCHRGSEANPVHAALSLDAPALAGIGSRRNSAWMAAWILDPKAQRATAQMPRLLSGPGAKEDALALAAYLSSLQDESSTAAQDPGDEAAAAGEALFGQLHCAACHVEPGQEAGDPQRLSLAHVKRKFKPGSLIEFLQQPEAHYQWTRMPNFKLTRQEASNLAAYLATHAEAVSTTTSTADAALVSRGKKLTQTLGCLNCHALDLQNEAKAPALAGLKAEAWERACLAEAPAADSRAPFFRFSPEQRSALQAFAASDRASLARSVPWEFAERHIRNLNCRGCHGQFDGFPPLEQLRGKLRPEWTQAFLSGQVSDKPRPWIEARMPSFPAYAEGLAHGLAAQHGFAPQSPRAAPVDAEAAEIGRRLVSAEGGFTCVACHAVGSMSATAVFESAGINLAYSSDRLLNRFFVRWLYNPLSIDPTSKMPVYFDEEGKSPLYDLYEGDGAKQIEALWQYIRMGEKMPPPAGLPAAP